MKGLFSALTVLASLAASTIAQDQVIMPAVPEPLIHTEPTLFDLLTVESRASIFFSYARETKASRLLVDQNANISLLVPTNKAVMALARKPHQGPISIEDDIEISEEVFEGRSKENVERWVSLHIIPDSPISLAAHTFPTLAAGKTVTFTAIDGDVTAPEWTRVLLNGEVQIVQMKKAANGVFYLIDGTVRDE
ncbi:hypothetical protein FA95DRAFT_1555510 [Auriscalpium vulgare]|uniref:Uncharacterized protein n=1 Tax=Auriscalpium vulgare TaxID=40419 RepID=A0ACB8S2L0_9AGAM|nr:hypothetical protein FA95DRAFT_1555510 [Auriscalpium vulgare]